MSATDDDAGPWLRVDRTPEGFGVAGELTHGTCDTLDERLRALDDASRECIVLDVAGVTFCDSSGLSTLIAAHRRARRTGTTIALVGVTGPLARLLALSGIGGLFASDRGAQSESG